MLPEINRQLSRNPLRNSMTLAKASCITLMMHQYFSEPKNRLIVFSARATKI